MEKDKQKQKRSFSYLHWRAHTVAIRQPNIITHTNLISIVKNGRAGKGKQQRVSQLDLSAIIVKLKNELKHHQKIRKNQK